MHIVFYSTSDVFKAEELLNESKIECKIVPTPVQDKAYCGVCVETLDEKAKDYLRNMEFDILS